MDGTLGLIATNTIAQGDTRLTGLAKIENIHGTIYRAMNNQPWPGFAAVIVSIVHISKGHFLPPFELNRRSVGYISSQLDSYQALGEPYTLNTHQKLSYIGSFTRGMGFVLEPEEADALLAKDPRNAEVVKPYINGQDLNSHPEQKPSRWVIDFKNMSLEFAKTYDEPMKVLLEKVYPERMGTPKERKVYEKIWWQFWRPRIELYETIAPLNRVLIRPRVSNTHAPVFVPIGWVYSEATVIFVFDDDFHFAVMQSTMHEEWARKYTSTLKGDVRYSPTDAFENYPFPLAGRDSVEAIGTHYYDHRRQIMFTRQEGLTATYNRFHDPEEAAADIARLRDLHVEMDTAVAAAYGWDDLMLGHDFHETQQGVRFTINEAARREVLYRLLALNHQRYAEEVEAGLHGKKGKAKAKAKGKGQKAKGGEVDDAQLGLF